MFDGGHGGDRVIEMSRVKFRLRNTYVVNPIYDGLSYRTLRITSILVCMAICDVRLESIALLGDRMCLRRAPSAACAIILNRGVDIHLHNRPREEVLQRLA
jgi:hypothetical protein